MQVKSNSDSVVGSNVLYRKSSTFFSSSKFAVNVVVASTIFTNKKTNEIINKIIENVLIFGEPEDKGELTCL